MKRPTYDIEYLSDHASDYGTSAGMSISIENVIDYVEYLEAKISGVVNVNPSDTCPECRGVFVWKMSGGGYCTQCDYEVIPF